MITVRELIELLQKEDPDRVVVMSKDIEGNGFSPLFDMSAHAYAEETRWAGELYDEVVGGDGVRALCLWPSN